MSLGVRLRAAVDPATRGLLRGDWDFGGDDPRAEVLTPAAVLIAVVTHARPTVLFTRRTTTMRRHAGQIAFPGGRIDPDDAGPVAAALREAHEEVALDPADVEVIGTTDAFETGTGFHITPVIGLIAPGRQLVPCVAEVAAIFEAPLDFLLDPANHQQRQAEWQGKRRTVYTIVWEGHEIWGATAGIVINLARRLA